MLGRRNRRILFGNWFSSQFFRTRIVGFAVIAVAACVQGEDRWITKSLKNALSLRPAAGDAWFWSDVLLFRDWRIQKEVKKPTFRLLDGQNHQKANGSLQQCIDRLAELCSEQKLEPDKTPAVVLLHGIVRSRESMRPLGRSLEMVGFRSYLFSYPLVELSIDEHAENLHRVLSHLEGPNEIHLVGHSMGGIVIRAYLAKHRDPRIKRVVMIASPNHGSEDANSFLESSIARKINVPAVRQLACGTNSFVESLPATMPAEFAIISAGKGDERGCSDKLPGDDDGRVSVASTLLAGASDHVLLVRKNPTLLLLHTLVIDFPETHAFTANFLSFGFLQSEQAKQPIPLPPQH